MTTQANCFDSAREFLKISGINQSESVLVRSVGRRGGRGIGGLRSVMQVFGLSFVGRNGDEEATLSIPNLKYQISGAGWPVGNPSRLIPAGTIIDTSLPQWSALAGPMPADAIALDQVTADWATSTNGQIHGLNYERGRVRCGPGVVSPALDQATSDYWEKPNDLEPKR
jgi:hypothetical protein